MGLSIISNFAKMLTFKNKLLIAFLFLGYAVYHLITLEISPMPWFDETFYTSMTHSYIEKGTLHQTVLPLFNNGREILWYGPVYFWLTSIPVKAFGLSIFNFRIISLVFGFFNIYVGAKLFKIYIKDTKMLVGCFLLWALDPLFNSGINSGRMDSVALCFVMISWYFFCSVEKKYITFLNPTVLLLLSGFFAGLAMLTSLRIYFLLLPIGAILLINSVRLKTFIPIIQGILFAIIPSVMCLTWFYHAFGNLDNFLTQYYYITDIQRMRFHIAIKQYPMVFFTILAVGYGIFKNYKAYFSEGLLTISLLSIILFYSLMDDTGPYSFLILPCYYFIFIYSLQFAKKKPFKYPGIIFVIFLFAWNIGIFSIKSLSLFFAYSQRKPMEINDFIKRNIPPGKKVVGDEMYYYSVTKIGSDFQYVHLSKLSGGLVTQEKYQREKYDYDYIIWSDRLDAVEPNILKYYSQNAQLEKIDVFVSSGSRREFDIPHLLGVTIIESYNCKIYKRIK